MANTLYHSFNFSRSGSPEAKIPADKLNDSIVSHVIVKTGFVYYKTLFKVSRHSFSILPVAIYVTARFKIWPILKPAAHFTMGQPGHFKTGQPN